MNFEFITLWFRIVSWWYLQIELSDQCNSLSRVRKIKKVRLKWCRPPPRMGLIKDTQLLTPKGIRWLINAITFRWCRGHWPWLNPTTPKYIPDDFDKLPKMILFKREK